VYDTYYDEVVRLSRVGDEVVAKKCHEAMVTWIKDDLEDPEGADYYHSTWSLDSGYGRFCVVYGGHGGSTTNGGTEANWRDKKEICPKTATLGTFIGALVHNIKCKGEEQYQRLIDAGEANRFPSIPRITDETWQTVMNCHPKTLVCTLAIKVKDGVQRKMSDMFDSLTEEMYAMGDADTPFHLRMGKWHNASNISDCDHHFKEATIGKLMMPSQRLLWEIDPDDTREIACVRHEVWTIMEEYKRLMKESDVSYKTKKLPELLDLYSKCHYLEYKTEGWSVVDWGCTCVRNLRDCVCMHSTLVGMFFHKNIVVPDTLERTLPSLRKVSAKRGMAGTKRRNYLAAKALETKKQFVKSKRLNIVGPMVSTAPPHH
jgi:hypothetical protein